MERVYNGHPWGFITWSLETALRRDLSDESNSSLQREDWAPMHELP